MTETNGPRDPRPGGEFFLNDTLERKALHADVLSRMFGELDPEDVQRLGRYELARQLGAGGMGTVYLARDPELDRKVAIKLLHRRGGDDYPEATERRLREEARAMARLNHPHVVHVHDVGRYGDQLFVAMEFVDGMTLGRWLSTPRAWRAIVRVFIDAGEGLRAAHEAGIVHRDFKPDNVLVHADGTVKVSDFGIALVTESPSTTTETSDSSDSSDSSDPAPAQTPAVAGTLAYMAPEHLRREPVDARSDQFSFCVALYEALHDGRPFAGTTVAALLSSMEEGLSPQASGSRAPSALYRILARGLAYEPTERWPTMQALLAALRRLVAPRRDWWIAAGLGAVALGVGLTAGSWLDEPRPCTDARRQLDGVWDDERRQEVRDAVLGTEIPYAVSTWERIEPTLDDYAERWTQAHTEICEATAVRHEQSDEALDLRMGCLRRRRADLRSAVDVLAQADPPVVRNAVRLVSALPSQADCNDLTALDVQHRRLPRPESAAAAQQVEALFEELSRSRAEELAGRYGPALEQLESQLPRAEALDHPPLVAEIEQVRGRILAYTGRYDDAEAALERAYSLALRHGHDTVVRQTAETLTFVVGDLQSRHLEGMMWGKTAVPLAEREGETLELASVLDKVGGLLYEQGRYEEAVQTHLRALGIAQKSVGPDHLAVATNANNLAMVYADLGQFDDAERYYREAHRIMEAALGGDHPYVAGPVGNLGNLLKDQGQYDEAEALQRQALEIKLGALGTEHPDVAITLNNLGLVFFLQGRHEEAEQHYQQALEIKQRTLGDEHPINASTLNNLADVFSAKEQYDQARTHHRRALEILQAALGPEHRRLTSALVGLAEVAVNQERSQVAREHAERALRIFEQSEGAKDDSAAARFVLARALWADVEQRARARELAEEARTVWASGGPVHAQQRTEVETWLSAHPQPEATHSEPKPRSDEPSSDEPP